MAGFLFPTNPKYLNPFRQCEPSHACTWTYLHGVYVHINLLFEGASVMKGAVGFQGETGGSLPLVVVANAIKSQIED
jgi:hypothetical protein